MPQVGDLSQRAMLVDLTVRQWTARKTDKRVGKEVAAAHNSDESMGRYWKDLIASDKMEPIRRKVAKINADHRSMTLPWFDSGERILTGAMYSIYEAKMRQHQDEYRSLVFDWLNGYEDYRADAKLKLNGLFDD